MHYKNIVSFSLLWLSLSILTPFAIQAMEFNGNNEKKDENTEEQTISKEIQVLYSIFSLLPGAAAISDALNIDIEKHEYNEEATKQLQDLLSTLVNTLATAQDDQIQLIKNLVAQGADVNIAVRDGKTLLLYAATCGLQDLVKFLLEHKAQVNVVDRVGTLLFNTLLSYNTTKSKEFSAIVLLLLQRGAVMNEAELDKLFYNDDLIDYHNGSMLSKIINEEKIVVALFEQFLRCIHEDDIRYKADKAILVINKLVNLVYEGEVPENIIKSLNRSAEKFMRTEWIIVLNGLKYRPTRLLSKDKNGECKYRSDRASNERIVEHSLTTLEIVRNGILSGNWSNTREVLVPALPKGVIDIIISFLVYETVTSYISK